MTIKRTIASTAMASVIGIGVVACGGSSAAHATTRAPVQTAPTTAQLGARYLAIVGPLNVAIDTANAREKNATTSAQYQATLTPLIPALRKCDDALLRMGLTGQAATDVRAFVNADDQYISAIQDGDFANITTILGSQMASVGAVRADLGLPPAAN